MKTKLILLAVFVLTLMCYPRMGQALPAWRLAAAVLSTAGLYYLCFHLVKRHEDREAVSIGKWLVYGLLPLLFFIGTAFNADVLRRKTAALDELVQPMQAPKTLESLKADAQSEDSDTRQNAARTIYLLTRQRIAYRDTHGSLATYAPTLDDGYFLYCRDQEIRACRAQLRPFHWSTGFNASMLFVSLLMAGWMFACHRAGAKATMSVAEPQGRD